MSRRRARIRPALSGRSFSNRTALGTPLLFATVALLAGCSADAESAETADATGDATQSETQSADSTGVDAESDETLSFGDPVDSGFAEVEDIDVDPEETPEADFEVLSAPDEVVAEVTEQLEAAPVEQSEEILDAVEIVDTKGDVADDRDGRSRNSSGELTILDDSASLACGHTEVALTHLDEGNGSIAIERIWSASIQAGESGIATIQEWKEPLAAVVADGSVTDLAPLIGFISVCAEGGYEL